jgi:hypothetical protein
MGEMEAVLERPRGPAVAARLGSARGAGLAAWTLGFAAPLYLALRGGGYEAVLRDQVGIALWWIVLLGVLLGVLPVSRPTRRQLLALSALVLFAIWTGLGALWSPSSEQTVGELSRLSTYAAMLALAILGVRAGARHLLIGGVTTAIAVVVVLALLSRLHPAWFPADQTAQFLPNARSRLNYPLNYWNGLAALTALGIPLALHFATSARLLVLRALSAAALPAMVATLYLTFSRGGLIEAAAAVLVYLALTPGRGWRLATLAVSGGGGALLIASIHQRPALDHGQLATAAARHGGNEVIAIALVVCLGVALLQGALALLDRHARRPELPVAVLRHRTSLQLAAVVVMIAVFVASGGPHALSHAWSDFKNPGLHVAVGQENTESRFAAVSGNGRYQYWGSALDAFSAHPVEGLGAGTFQFWWAAHGSIYSYVVNAHSLYFETLAETGLLGLVLLVGLFGAGIAALLGPWRRSAGNDRALLAAALGACAAFCVAAGVDWVWQIPAVPVVFLMLIGGGSARRRRRGTARAASPSPRRAGLAWSAAWVGLALAGVAALVLPMASGISLRESQAQARVEHLEPALQDARTAGDWQPYASSPRLQQGLVLEASGDYPGAAAAARKAVSAAPTDWKAWLVLSRIEAEAGQPSAAVAAYRRARLLNPRDPLFAVR